MQTITAEKAVMMSRPEARRSMVIAMTDPPQISMNARTAKMMLFSTLWPESFTGRYARGWMMDMSSRSAWRTMSSARIILMPLPVDPEQVAKQHRNSIHTGAKIGHWLKSVLEKPVVVAIDTTLNAL